MFQLPEVSYNRNYLSNDDSLRLSVGCCTGMYECRAIQGSSNAARGQEPVAAGRMDAQERPVKNLRGFTLTELLVVLVIVGLLAALVAPVLYQRINPAKESVARAQMESFMTALDSYFLDTGKFPSNQQGLAVLRTKPDGESRWKGPYLKKELPNDPWRNPYVYRSPGRNGGYEITSYGADGKEGGENENADINSWESKSK